MATWAQEELRKIAEADDLHIVPFRDDGMTYGTPTWICNRHKSRWSQAAVRMKASHVPGPDDQRPLLAQQLSKSCRATAMPVHWQTTQIYTAMEVNHGN